MTNTNIDYNKTKKAALVLRAVNNKLRQKIIQLLDETTELTVTEIYVTLRIEQSVASQSLAILRRSNIVSTRRQGKMIYYSINYETLEKINTFTEALLK